MQQTMQYLKDQKPVGMSWSLKYLSESWHALPARLISEFYFRQFLEKNGKQSWNHGLESRGTFVLSIPYWTVLTSTSVGIFGCFTKHAESLEACYGFGFHFGANFLKVQALQCLNCRQWSPLLDLAPCLFEMVMVLFPAETRCAYICVLNLESRRLWENMFPVYPIFFTETPSHY